MVTDTGIHADEEVEITNPCHVHPEGLDGDHGDVTITKPYETPIALKRQRKKRAPVPVVESDVEVVEVEEGKRSFKPEGNKKQRKGDKAKAFISSF